MKGYTMSHTVLLFLALFAGAALAQSTEEAQKVAVAATDEHSSDYYADHEHYGHEGSTHGKHKSHKNYQLTIPLVITNYDFLAEGGNANIGNFLTAPNPIGMSGVFTFKLRPTATGDVLGDGVITGTFYKRMPETNVATTVFANEVVSIELADGDFAGSQLTAIGRLAFALTLDMSGQPSGNIVSPTNVLTVTGGTGDLLGATGTITIEGGVGPNGSATALLHLTVPKHI